ncbi:hypothetical protein OsI_25971 [Oryza sativa Indica Group]|uniref:Uncharacterized protein n=1 Tax=Oryza sativa subsp. indica TaxID=39946 RepID=A2YL79_ORYSI|nr:hypothetical protein OsI_25971 [Oryza sativa Indica Group]
MAAASIDGEGGSAPLSSIYDDGICRQWFAKMLVCALLSCFVYDASSLYVYTMFGRVPANVLKGF